MQIRSRFPYLRPSFLRPGPCEAPPAKPKKKTAEELSLSRTRGGRRVSNETLAAMRWDYECEGMPPSQVAKKYGVDYAICCKFLDYTTRAHIEPQKFEG